ncbi:MAG: nuclear transport factor 2 family protein [Gammaproteobacteria bacterium]|nr:nuclear transport factor 2 family protein [Gammaproteobacteria bacterium]MDD9896432.1 nuclear transport factor 2 family protein [Gammaproteobacteria bacterium]MDD9959527.1 nuclear transport factor 2 family protein [Gammaproteobacteria bacterium]
MIKRTLKIVSLHLLLLYGLHIFAQESERTAILATIQKFFDSIETRDRELLESILVRDSLNISVRTLANGDTNFNIMSYDDVVNALTRPGRDALERSWDETVLIRGNIAVVWTPYDFHIDGEFSHCGVDSFQLIKQEGRWLISNSSWTLETEDCPESPLGPID